MDKADTVIEKVKASRKAGFTLADTVISTFILAMGLGAAGLTFNSAMRMTAANNNRMSAMHLARYQMETLRNYAFADPVLEAGTHPINDIVCGELMESMLSKLANLGDMVSPPDEIEENALVYVIKDITPRIKEVIMDVPYLNPMNNQMSQARLTTRLTKPLH